MHLLALLFFLNLVLNVENYGYYQFFDPVSHKNWKLLHSKKCGFKMEDRVVGGTPVTMGAYPWMARIAYSNDYFSKTVFKCGGVLANEKTVITAAHCLEGKGSFSKVAFVRLGEYDTRSNEDCYEDTCAKAVQDIDADSTLIHEDYFNNPFANDIGLIRLKKKVKYSFYVQPICFLYGDKMTKTFLNEKAIVAGWGITDSDTLATSPILLAVELPIIDNSICKNTYAKVTTITKEHLCVGGEKGKDSCGGDSGGPLMKVEDFEGLPKYYLIGIVSFGPRKCGTENIPGVYTRITEYMEWILDNIVG